MLLISSVSLLQYLRDYGDYKATIGVNGGKVVSSLSVVRPCGRKVLSRRP
jgi:hypothetical protein